MKVLKTISLLLFITILLFFSSCERDPSIERGNYLYENQELVYIREITIPTVSTNDIYDVTRNSAFCGGNVISDGGEIVTARGVCWSSTLNPTIRDSHTIDGSGVGSFTSSITELTPNTTYYVRAYATNSAGTAYGDEMSFTTEPIPEPVVDEKSCYSTPIVTDYEGNSYATVQIGDQCWMRDNLRTTYSADGFSIPAGGYYDCSSQSLPLERCGYLYTWSAAMFGASSSSTNPSEVQGVCPNGWHLPSDAEWTILANYIKSQIVYTCGDSSNFIAKALASTNGWNTSTTSCAVGNAPNENNILGFTSVPIGGYNFGEGLFAYFWSCTQVNGNNAYYYYLYYDMATFNRNNIDKNNRFSIRCLRN